MPLTGLICALSAPADDPGGGPQPIALQPRRQSPVPASLSVSQGRLTRGQCGSRQSAQSEPSNPSRSGKVARLEIVAGRGEVRAAGVRGQEMEQIQSRAERSLRARSGARFYYNCPRPAAVFGILQESSDRQGSIQLYDCLVRAAEPRHLLLTTEFAC